MEDESSSYSGWPPYSHGTINANDNEVTVEYVENGIAELEAFLATETLAVA